MQDCEKEKKNKVNDFVKCPLIDQQLVRAILMHQNPELPQPPSST